MGGVNSLSNNAEQNHWLIRKLMALLRLEDMLEAKDVTVTWPEEHPGLRLALASYSSKTEGKNSDASVSDEEKNEKSKGVREEFGLTELPLSADKKQSAGG